MAKVIKQTMTDFDEKKHSLRANADKDDKSVLLTSAYLMHKAMEKAGVKPDRVKSIDIQVTFHEKK
jgi:ABC-type nitrate/sulfonate/bicarbonate transport system substrate-binding protein